MGKVHKDIAMFMVNNAKEEEKSDEQLVTVSILTAIIAFKKLSHSVLRSVDTPNNLSTLHFLGLLPTKMYTYSTYIFDFLPTCSTF